ncbi:hypothetical protein [Pedobacter mendelii]|uniref:Uncharacterized protein n=1 Tax=Pedobacter mendelii TaxID=1908240 RepID=A0ABQ2BIZ7_9SPHI|nr:hypothetical protein [Pedobacter mendelii]GGI24555.1 hypothetical protein GCM10008119_13240 [Pedobacter mendelii]
MKNFIIISVLCLFFVACAKEIPEPDVVKLQVYSTKIKYANHNEPDILYWYLREANKGGYFYITSTTDIKNFSDYTFTYAAKMPEDLLGKSAIKDIVVFINQLNGDMFFDITGKTAITLLGE